MPPKKKADEKSAPDAAPTAPTQLTLPSASQPIPLQNIDTLQFPDEKFGCSFLLLGSTRSGKSTLINYLFAKYFKKHTSILMSNSLQSDAYKPLKKSCICSDLYHTEVLRELYQVNHATDNHYKFLCIIDDVSHVRHDKQYQRLLTIYRNSRISAIVSAQALTMFDKNCRSNVNFVLLGRLNSDVAIEGVIKEYLISHFPRNIRMVDKVALYRQMTENHHWFVIDNINGVVFRTKLTPQQVMV
jgi:hypothetical protein